MATLDASVDATRIDATPAEAEGDAVTDRAERRDRGADGCAAAFPKRTIVLRERVDKSVLKFARL